MFDSGERGRQGDLSQTGAVLEGAVADFGDAVGDGQLGESGALLERFIANGSQGVGERNAGHRSASPQSINGGDARANLYGGGGELRLGAFGPIVSWGFDADCTGSIDGQLPCGNLAGPGEITIVAYRCGSSDLSRSSTATLARYIFPQIVVAAINVHVIPLFHSAKERDILQGFTAGEGIHPDEGDAVGNSNGLQSGTVAKGTIADALDVLRQLDAG